MDNYYVQVENGKNENCKGIMFPGNLVLAAIKITASIIKQSIFLAAMMIRIIFNPYFHGRKLNGYW